MATNTTQKFTYEQSLKSLDTEEWLDLKFYRPVGYRWALFFARLGVTPNAVSVMSIFLGILAGLLFYPDNVWINVAGMFFLVWANSYDSADGQLARLTGNFSRFGRILDGACGDIWFITIYAAICFRLMPEWGIYIWLLAAFAGFWHSKQAAMADYYRNFHLFFVKGKSGSELDDSTKVEQEYRAISFKAEPLYKVFMMFYVNYTKNQEALTPQMQKLRTTLRTRFGDRPLPAELNEAFRAQSMPLMKYTNILSFNTRVIALFISLLIGLPWLYFVFELTVLNALLYYMVTTHERICRQFNEQLTSQ